MKVTLLRQGNFDRVNMLTFKIKLLNSDRADFKSVIESFRTFATGAFLKKKLTLFQVNGKSSGQI